MIYKLLDYIKFNDRVLPNVSYMFNLFLMMVIGITYANMTYYKDGYKQSVSSLIKIDKLLSDVNLKLSVLETHYYEIPEDFSIMEKSVAAIYAEKFMTLKRIEGVIKNIVFINYLSEVKLESAYVELIAGAFYDASITYQMDSRELIATAWHESRFKPSAKSKVGATGVMQIMALWLRNDKFNNATDVHDREDLLDPVKNIQAGAYIYDHYKRYWKRRGYKKDFNIRRLALLSYNRGSGRVSKLIRQGINPANGYFKVINRKFAKLKKLEKSMI